MVDPESHFFLKDTTLDENGVIWGWESPFLVILVPSNCFSSASVSASYGNDLGVLASLWLLVTLSRTSAARPGRWVWREVSGFHFIQGLTML